MSDSSHHHDDDQVLPTLGTHVRHSAARTGDAQEDTLRAPDRLGANAKTRLETCPEFVAFQGHTLATWTAQRTAVSSASRRATRHRPAR